MSWGPDIATFVRGAALRALGAEEMQALVLVGSPDLVTHWQKMARDGTERNLIRSHAIRHLGPWTGGAEGGVQRLRLPYRSMLTEQGFARRDRGLRAPCAPPARASHRSAQARNLPGLQFCALGALSDPLTLRR